MKAYWFKLHHDILSDIKMRRFSGQEKWAWVAILCLASQSSDRGSVIADDEDIADACGFLNVQDWLYFKDKLRTKGMVDLCEGGLSVTNWEQRQYENPSDAPKATRERKRQQRDRQRTADITTCHDNVTSESRLVTHRGDKRREEEIREDHTACVLKQENSSQREQENSEIEIREFEQPAAEAIAQQFTPVNQVLELATQTEKDTCSAASDDSEFLNSLMAVSITPARALSGYIHPAQKVNERFGNPDAYPWKKDKDLLRMFLGYLCNTYGRDGENKERRMAIASGMVRNANFSVPSAKEYQRVHDSWLLFRENAMNSSTVEEATAEKPKMTEAMKFTYKMLGRAV